MAVVGGGLTGVETASEVAEQHPGASVTLYSAGALVPDMRPAARRSLLRSLGRLGVRVEQHTAVVRIEDRALHLCDGREQEHDICIVAAAFDVPDLAAVSGLRVDEAGRMRVDQHLRCLDDPTILGAGDAIVAPPAVGGHLRMGCAVALPLGAHAAETLLATIRGTTPRALSIGFAIQCISLGRRNGYIQLVRADDTPRGLHLGGRVAARIKEKVCEMVVTSPKDESTAPGTYSWPKGPTRTLSGRTDSMSARRHRAAERYGGATDALLASRVQP
jgi:NADH dehydrogenase FAD-containing subunit